MINSVNNCYECNSCIVNCPFKAIDKIKNDSLNSVYIKNNLCINCGLCMKLCEDLNCCSNTPNLNVKIIKGNNSNEYSSSSGIITKLMIFYFQKGYSVYGIKWDINTQEFYIDKLNNLDEIIFSSGSRYVQSRLKECYGNIKKDIKNNKNILFVGSPCQVASIKIFFNFYSKSKKINLLTIDFLCHGMPSSDLLKEEIKLHNKSRATNVRFRDKNNYVMKIDYEDGESFVEASSYNRFFGLFLEGTSFKKSCYSCKYANENRISDLTVGDYVHNNQCIKNKSVCIYHNNEIFEVIKNLSEIEIVDYDIVNLKKLQSSFVRPVEYSYKVDLLNKNLLRFNYKKAINKTYRFRNIKICLIKIRDKYFKKRRDI